MNGGLHIVLADRSLADQLDVAQLARALEDRQLPEKVELYQQAPYSSLEEDGMSCQSGE